MLRKQSQFPIEGLLPKEETGAAQFVQANPEYDGRGVVIAILDTGVDPGAPGLQVTTDGKPKVINLIDCTGSGDVLMNTIATAFLSDDNKLVLKALSGRKVKISASWKNPSNKWRIGVKQAYDIFPKSLVDRLKERRKQRFEVEHHSLLTSAERFSANFEKANPGETNELETKLDLKDRVQVLRDQFNEFEESGWLLDCIVWHDGDKYRAVIDVDESADVSAQLPLTNFVDERQFIKFDKESQLNYAVNIYDEGEILSIVTLAGSHGTHVAGIAAAHYPQDPQASGIAPGAQIISLKVGDTRLVSTETGLSFIRAAIELCRLKCDLANISYGEPAAVANVGKIVELLRDEVINKSGCIIVSSAGNEGPCLTTVGAPGGTTATVLSVGAYVTKNMMKAEYSMIENVPESPYTWSSRGPTNDGAHGTDIYAPGGAITSVPTYTLQSTQLMNGTSMSSPSMCGGVALLLSALKANNMSYSPYRVKYALLNTSLDIQDPLKVGFAQIMPAWEYLKTNAEYQSLDLSMETSILERKNARGIYLREPEETRSVSQWTIQVKPLFPKNDDPSSAEAKLDFEVRMSLVSDVSWITGPDFLLLNSGGRTFTAEIDPTHLKPGLHVGRILGYDTNRKDAGVLVSVPVTIVKPLLVDSQSSSLGIDGAYYISFHNLDFIPGTIERRFIAVPHTANFVDLILKSENRETAGRFIIQVKQLVSQVRHDRFSKEWVIAFGTNNGLSRTEQNAVVKTFTVVPGVTLELCIAQFWNSLGKTKLSVEVKFHGIFLSSANHLGGNASPQGYGVLWLNSGNYGFSRLEILAPIRKEEIQLSMSLDTLQKSIRPDSCIISPLKSRDVLPDTRQIHQAILTYIFKSPEGGASVTPRFPRLNEVLYDSTFEGFFGIVYNANKKPVSSQDIYPKVIKVSDGTYTFKAQVTSRSLDLLDRISNMPMVLDITLAKPVSMSAYNSLESLVSGTSEFKRKTLDAGDRLITWTGGIEGSSLPKDAKPGDILCGKIDIGPKVEGELFSLAYVVPSEVKQPPSTPTLGADAPQNDASTQMKEDIRDLEIQYLKKLKKEVKTQLLAKLEQDWADYLPLLVAKLELLAEEEEANTTVSSELAHDLVTSADKLLERVDMKELAQWFGVRHDMTLKANVNKNKEMIKLKEYAIYALQWKCHGLRDAILAADDIPHDSQENQQNQEPVSLSAFDTALAQYSQWLSEPATNDGKYFLLWAWRQRRTDRFGTAIKAVNKFLAESKNLLNDQTTYNALLDFKKELLADLGWEAWIKYEERRLNPTDWQPF